MEIVAKVDDLDALVRRDPRNPAGGHPGGSLETTRRSFNKDFLLALAADFKKHGAAAIEKVRKTQPAAGKLRGISYALYIILGINLIILAGLAWLALRDVPFW